MQSGCLPCQQAQMGALNPPSSTTSTIVGIVSVASGAASAYHGYKRNRSVGWAFGWFVFGSVMPFFALPLALAEGYAKPKGRR